MLSNVANGSLWVLFVAALFYAGGFSILLFSLINIVRGGCPPQLWAILFPLRALHERPEDTIATLQTDQAGVVDVMSLPLLDDAAPLFLIAILAEAGLAWLHRKPYYDSFADTISCLSAGILSQTSGAILAYVGLFPYAYIYENFRIVDPFSSNTLMWVVALLCVDFCYYLFHRASHERSFWWSAHSVHHSSGSYNLAVALRQPFFGSLDNFMFYLPLALVIPPQHFQGHKALNLLYQFWIHTQFVGKLWRPIEWIWNTPSHHRVHHGRNEHCVDKNYAGMLIIWDRMFGTFQEEEDDEEITYGVIPPMESVDPMYTQLHYFEVLWRLMRRAPWSETWKYLFVGPGRRYRLKQGEWKELPLPPLGSRYNPRGTPPFPNLPFRVTWYTTAQFLTALVAVFAMFLRRDIFPGWRGVLAVTMYVLPTLWTIGLMHDLRPLAWAAEATRCASIASFILGTLLCSAASVSHPNGTVDDWVLATMWSLVSPSLTTLCFWLSIASAVYATTEIRYAMDAAVLSDAIAAVAGSKSPAGLAPTKNGTISASSALEIAKAVAEKRKDE